MNKERKTQESFSKTSISWYPGHMVKAQNEIKESLKLIDIVLEVLDARAPLSSRNPIIEEFAKDKQRIIILNKSDLADEEKTKQFVKYFEEKNMRCIVVDSSNPSDIKKILESIKQVGKSVYNEKNKNKKIEINNIYRVLIVGIPNVGKSTIINKMAGKNSANTGNKPGITVKKQWIRLSNNIDLLDTPGLLWPKLEGENVGLNLALTGNIKQEILDEEELACDLINMLLGDEKYKDMLCKKYKLEEEDLEIDTYNLLELIGRKRGAIISGGNVDMSKASKLLLDDFKAGKIGKITLDNI